MQIQFPDILAKGIKDSAASFLGRGDNVASVISLTSGQMSSFGRCFYQSMVSAAE
jgi:hypothetical protein